MAEHYIIDDKEHVYESAAEKHLTDKTITENGTYSAEDEPGDINGYKNVTVDVEGGGGGSTLVEKTVTQNGTYDPADDNADGYSQVTVNVPFEYVDSPVNDYAFDYEPSKTASTVRSGGFMFLCKIPCKITKIRVYGVSTEAKVFISDVNGKTLASGSSDQIIVNQWNDVELDSPIDLFENYSYVVWASQNGSLLKYQDSFNWVSSSIYLQHQNGMYSQFTDTFPANREGNIAYAVDLYIDSIKVIKTAELITKQITQNGIYNASDDNVDGFKSVNVNVPSEPILPLQYQEVEYIETYGDQYCSINYDISVGDKIETSIAVPESILSTKEMDAFGRDSSWSLAIDNGSIYWWSIFDGDYKEKSEAINNYIPEQKYDIYAVFNKNFGSFLFGRYKTDKYAFYGRLFALTICTEKNNNTPVKICKLIPCYRKNDGEIGMYDVYSRTFYTNIGSGSFGKGPDV